MKARAAALLGLMVGCSGATPGGGFVEGDACEPGASDDFVMGVVQRDETRWFKAFDDGCRSVELQTGLQGGWHIEPALQAPSDASREDLGGEVVWEVRDVDGAIVADGQFELFRNFWQTLAGGDAYWGDYVIFYRDPADLVGSTITLTCMLRFDGRSSLGDTVLEADVMFVDEEPNVDFE